MQFSPIMERETITIAECQRAIEALREGKEIPEDIILKEPQKRFLACVVKLY